MEEIELKLGNYMLKYDPSIKEYMKIDKSFNKVASESLSDATEQYKSMKNIETVHNNFFDVGVQYLSNAAEVALKICSEYGIYDLNVARFLNATDFGKSPLAMWQEYYNLVDDTYNKILGVAAAEKAARQLRKDTRGRVIGGGFGLSGALKGMIEAGTINMLTGAAHGVINTLGNMQTDNIAAKNKDELYKNPSTLNTLKSGIALGISILKNELLTVLNIHPFPNENINKSSAILENISKGIIPEEKLEEALIEAFVLNPFSEKVYEIYLCNFGDKDNSLENFADFFNLKDFVYYKKVEILFDYLGSYFKLDENDSVDILQSMEKIFNSQIDIRDILRGCGSPISAFDGLNKEEVEEQFNYAIGLSQKLGLFCYADILLPLSEIKSYIEHMDQQNESIKNIEISLNNDCIEAYEFFKYKSIESITIPPNINEIKTGAFAYCETLKEINFNEGLLKIGSAAFFKVAIERLVLPKNLEIIGKEAFAECRNLSFLEIPEGVKIIEDGAFENCENLKEVRLPNSLEKIGKDIFGKKPVHILCSVGSVAAKYSVENEYILPNIFTKNNVKTRTNSNYFSIEDCVLPESCTAVDDYAFAHNEKLEVLTIPSSVKEIGKEAFAGCKNLRKILFSSGLEKIGEDAFANCTSLEEVILPDTVREIGDGAFFYDIKLKKLYLPEGVEKISSGIIYCSGVKQLSLPSSLREIKNSENGKSDFSSEDIEFICEKESYAYEYCKKYGLKVIESETVVEEVRKTMAEKEKDNENEAKDNQKKAKGEWGAQDTFGCLVWIIGAILLIRWLF